MGNWNLKGKTAVITGGTKGIGFAIASEFLSLGADILIVARDQSLLDERINNWKNEGFAPKGISLDLAD